MSTTPDRPETSAAAEDPTTSDDATKAEKVEPGSGAVVVEPESAPPIDAEPTPARLAEAVPPARARTERPALAALRAPHPPSARVAAVLAETQPRPGDPAVKVTGESEAAAREATPTVPAESTGGAASWQQRFQSLSRTVAPLIKAAFSPVPTDAPTASTVAQTVPSSASASTGAIRVLDLDAVKNETHAYADPPAAGRAPVQLESADEDAATAMPAARPTVDEIDESVAESKAESTSESTSDSTTESTSESTREPEQESEQDGLSALSALVGGIGQETEQEGHSGAAPRVPRPSDRKAGEVEEVEIEELVELAPTSVVSVPPTPPIGPQLLDEAKSLVSSTIDATRARIAAARTAPRTPPRAPRRVSAKPIRIPAPERDLGETVLEIDGLTKRFGEQVAVDDVDLEVKQGSFYGIVGPNGAGKTTTLSMITGLLRPDAGRVLAHGVDVWEEPARAKRIIGVLPDALRLFDRLTGAQLLYYSGALRGLDDETVRARAADLATAFGIEDAVDRLVADYSAGMTKKIALAAAMIHSPRLLVLDEPFESVDPVSAANLIEILQRYVASGGTVVLSSHGMDLIQRVCDHVAIIVNGRVLSAGTMDEVRGSASSRSASSSSPAAARPPRAWSGCTASPTDAHHDRADDHGSS